MAKTQTYPMEKVLAARAVLQQLPAKEKEKSRTEVVEFLKADLRKAVKQGHSLKAIQAILAEHGVNVPLSRMEAVLGQAGERNARRKVWPEGLPITMDRTADTTNMARDVAGNDNSGEKFSSEPPS